jgi:MurNAc alpha-1-phosphate uridylyltransferase
MKAMIFAAGLGTRFKPWTDQHPKALAVINGKSLLQRNVEYLQRYGITEIIVNVHHFAKQVIDAIQSNKGWGSNIIISHEEDELLETGGGLKKASWYLDTNPFVVINADVLTDMDLAKMLEYHHLHKSLATLAVTDRKTSRYFLFDDHNELCGWKNTKTGEEKITQKNIPLIQKAFSGIHIIDPRIFSLMTHDGKFSIVDTYLDLSKKESIKSFDHSGSKFVDVGKTEAVEVAEKLFP